MADVIGSYQIGEWINAFGLSMINILGCISLHGKLIKFLEFEKVVVERANA